MKRTRWQTMELWLVVLISLHSMAVGVFLLFLPDWSAAFGGWGQVEHRFFPRQGGAFHLVVAAGYLHEYLRYRGVTLLIIAKLTAVIFLVAMTFINVDGAWAVPASAAADGSMALAVAVVHRWVRRGQLFRHRTAQQRNWIGYLGRCLWVRGLGYWAGSNGRA